MMAAGRGSAVDWESIARGMMGGTEDYEVVWPSDITTIRDYVFIKTKLTSLTIPDGVTQIGSQIIGYTKVTNIVVPNSVTKILTLGLGQCTTLKTIDIGTGINNIGAQCFRYDNALEYIIIRATTPPALEALAFDRTNNCPIYVPDGSVATYKAASRWSDVASRIFSINDMP